MQVRVELPPEDGILALPQTALVTSLYGDFIFVVRPAEQAAGQARARSKADEGTPAEPAKPQLAAYQVFVKAGRRNEGMVEILRGAQGRRPGGHRRAEPALQRRPGDDRQHRRPDKPAAAARPAGAAMSISELFIRRPGPVDRARRCCILLLGFQGIFNLPVRQYPEVEETVDHHHHGLSRRAAPT